MPSAAHLLSRSPHEVLPAPSSGGSLGDEQQWPPRPGGQTPGPGTSPAGGEGCSGWTPTQHPRTLGLGYRAGTVPRGSQPQSQGLPSPTPALTPRALRAPPRAGHRGGRVPLPAPQEPDPRWPGTALTTQSRPSPPARRSSGGCGHREDRRSIQCRAHGGQPGLLCPTTHSPSSAKSTPERHRGRGGGGGGSWDGWPSFPKEAAKSAP